MDTIRLRDLAQSSGTAIPTRARNETEPDITVLPDQLVDRLLEFCGILGVSEEARIRIVEREVFSPASNPAYLFNVHPTFEVSSFRPRHTPRGPHDPLRGVIGWAIRLVSVYKEIHFTLWETGCVELSYAGKTMIHG